jgi:hypothetical protein
MKLQWQKHAGLAKNTLQTPFHQCKAVKQFSKRYTDLSLASTRDSKKTKWFYQQNGH